jgi:PAS domain S-box-containing protein
MRVGELARRTGVGVSTLRAWESRFQFLEPKRSPAGHRLYDDADVERVEAVVRLVGEGLTLAAAIARVAMVGPGALPEGEADALLYGQILHAANQGIWVSRDGRTRYANRRMAEIMGYSVEELLAIPVLEFFPPDELPVVRERTTVVRAGQRVHFTQRLRRADGSLFLAEIDTTPLLNQAGRYEGAVSIVADVTARHEAEVRSRLQATLLDAIEEAATAATADGKIAYVNAAAERMLGWRLADVVGRDGRKLMAAAAASEKADRMHAALLEGERYAGRFTLQRQDGTEFVVSLKSMPAFDEEGAVIGLVGLFRDQTEPDQIAGALQARDLQTETLALLGVQVLRRRSSPENGASPVVTEVVEATRRVLNADLVVALDLITERDELVIRFSSPYVEPITVPTGSRSFSGYVALARKPVLVDDLSVDRRFDAKPVIPLASALGAPIFGPDGVCGVLAAGNSKPNTFDRGAVHFIQGMANVLGTARLS